MNHDRHASHDSGSLPQNDRVATDVTFGKIQPSALKEGRAPSSIRALLNPIDDTRTENRLPSLQSVLSTYIRRDTTSPPRYPVASRSPRFNHCFPAVEPGHTSQPPWLDRMPSPTLAPPQYAEIRRYSQPSPHEDTWDPWAQPLSKSTTYPDARPARPSQRLSAGQSREQQGTLSFSRSLAATSLSHEDQRRDSGRAASNTLDLTAATTQLEVVGQADIPGKGLCYVYQDGSICPTVIDDLPVNPAWGTTKAGKPRKRLAQACLPCREKKIRCEPRTNGCLQCDKAKRICKMSSSQQPPDQYTDAPTPRGRSLGDFGGYSEGDGRDYRRSRETSFYNKGGRAETATSSLAPYTPPAHALTSAVSMPDFRAR